MAVVKLEDICLKIGSGATPRGGKEAYSDTGISLIRSQNVLDYTFSSVGLAHINETQADKLKNVIVEENDVLLNITGDSVARACIVDSGCLPARVNQHVCIIRADTRYVLGSYLLYFLQMNKQYLLQLASGGATRNALTKEMICNLKIELPSLEEQRRITSLLDSIQAKIEINKRISDNLEQQAFALFDSWFVSLDRTDGVIPNGWSEGILGDIAVIASGKRPSMKQESVTAEATIPLVGAASIMGYTNEFLYNEPILITGRVGTHGIVQRFQSPCWASDNTLVIKSKFYEYTYQILKRVDYVNMNRGSTQPLITQTDLKNVPIVLLTESEMFKFEEIASTLMAMYEANRKENDRLVTLRDTLLPRLMSSEIDVSNIGF